MCPADITMETDQSSDTAIVSFSMRFADNVDNRPHATCDPMSGSSFDFGETPVNCTVVDSSNNMVKCNFTVTVIGKYFSTLLSDRDMNPHSYRLGFDGFRASPSTLNILYGDEIQYLFSFK